MDTNKTVVYQKGNFKIMSDEVWYQVEKLIEPVGFSYSSEFWSLSKDPKGLCVWEHWDSGEKIAVDGNRIWSKSNGGDSEEVTINDIKSIAKWYKDAEPNPMKAESLEELCESLNKLAFNYCRNEEHEFFLGNNLSSLPLFGGKEPLNTEGFWSWDEESFLVYEEEEWKIQPRSDFDWVKYE